MENQLSNPTTPLPPTEGISEEIFPIHIHILWVVEVFLKLFPIILIFGALVIRVDNNSSGGTSDYSMNNITVHGGDFLMTYIIFVTLSSILLLVCIYFSRKSFLVRFMYDYISVPRGWISSAQDKHVPYNKIQDVSVTQDAIERIFGLYSVLISSAPSGYSGLYSDVNTPITIPGQSREQANKVVEFIRAHLPQGNQNKTGL